MSKGRRYYLDLRAKYAPQTIRVIFILESPPISGIYFYNPYGRTTETLFGAMMKYALDFQPSTKEQGLIKFMEAGYLLVNAIYEPVNKLSSSQRDKRILESYPLLSDDLKRIVLSQKPGIPGIILVKANICRLLEKKLCNDGFNVINGGVMVPFPACGHQKSFGETISTLLARVG